MENESATALAGFLGTTLSWLGPFAVSPLTWFMLVAGACVGSFLNVCIFRIPEGTFWKKTRSVCGGCGKVVPFYLNVPIFSWIFLRGRARCCGAPLSIQYPLVEAFTAIIFVVLYWKFPFITLMGTSPTTPIEIYGANLVRFLHAVVLVSLLIVCSVIDIHHMIIPDVISLPMIGLTPVVVAVHPELGWIDALIGVILGGGLLYGIAWVYWMLRKEVGMGMGDVKLLAGLGGWLGYPAIIPIILYGSVIGSLFGLSVIALTRRLNLKSAIPFGPFLAIGAVIHMLIGSRLHEFLAGM